MRQYIQIFKADKKDIQDILNIENLCFTVDQFNKRQFVYLLSKSFFFIAKLSNQTVGYIILLHHKNSKKLRLYSIAVHPDARNKHIAYHLLNHAYTLGIRLKMEGIKLEVRETNLSAIHLYKKFGFEFTGMKEAYYADGAHAAVMYLSLNKNV